jgi:hypothetical protein
MARQKLEGQKFGSWLVVEYNSVRGYKCQCVCGTVSYIRSTALIRKKSTRCWDCRLAYSDIYGGRNKVFHLYKSSARSRNLPFTLTLDDAFEKLIQSPCHYCGDRGTNFLHIKIRGQTKYIYNGIDRIDSSKGYEEGNVHTCCRRCNFAKLTDSVEEFYAWLERLKNFHSVVREDVNGES